MSQTDQISRVILYNPELFSRDELVRQFVVRTSLLKRLLADIPDSLDQGSRQHQLVTGQRGMGKSTLLRRLQVAIREDATLSQVWVPLTFPEEQYNIDQPSDLWLNCLDALGDAFERAGDEAGAEGVDTIVERTRALPKAERNDAALRELLAAADRLGRGFVLLIDNLDMVFRRLKEHHWSLRETLSHERRLILIGTTATDIREIYNYDEAFYDFLKVHRLSGLSYEETVTLLTVLGEATGRTEVVPRIQSDPGRLETLRVLTGGVPRIIAALFQVLATHSDSTIREDVEELLDKFSPYYKDRIEDLPDQAQQVFHAIAVAWDPISAAGVAEAAGLPSVSQAAAQLKRLSQNGVVDEVPLSLKNDKGYQLSERFFNIWYLFRASRRHRRRVSWLVEFLKLFYGQRLEDTARRLLGSGLLCHGTGARSAETLLGWAGAVSDPSLSFAFTHRGVRELITASGNVQQQVAELLDLQGADSELQPVIDRVSALENARRQIEQADVDWPRSSPAEFWDLLGGSPLLSVSERCVIADRVGALPLENRLALTRELQDEARLLEQSLGKNVASALRQALREGMMASMHDVLGAGAAAEATGRRELLQVAERAATEGGGGPTVADIGRLRHLESLFLNPNRADDDRETKAAQEWLSVVELAVSRGDYDEAESALEKAVAAAPRLAAAWSWQGWLYQEERQRYAEAETAYFKAIECDPQDSYPWYGLGNLLQDHLGRYTEAEEAFRNAIRLDPESAGAWNNLGNLLQDHLGRYTEAEEAIRNAIRLDPTDAIPWNNLGNLLQDHLGRYTEAEEAYRTAIRLQPDLAIPWFRLGCLLDRQIGRQVEAEDAYRTAIHHGPKDADAYNNLAWLFYSIGHNLEEAEALARTAVALSKPCDVLFNSHTLACILARSAKWEECWIVARQFIDPEAVMPREIEWVDLVRFFREVVAGGEVACAVDILDELDLGERWRPMRAALVVVSEQNAESLLRLAPEVRGPAEELLRQLWPEGAEAALAVIHRKVAPRRRRE